MLSAPSRTILIAGAGIAGLTASLALAQRGFRVIIAEKAAELTEVGAGIQLSPNATRILFALGCEAALMDCGVTPEAIGVMSARTTRPIVRIPLGAEATQRYGAPYLVLHRADLQRVLLDRVRQVSDIDLRLGVQVGDVATNSHGIAAGLLQGDTHTEESAIALIGADGVWSSVRSRLFGAAAPQFSGKIAWRGMLEAARLPYAVGPYRMQLWLGAEAHVVLYPVRGGRSVNVVAIADGDWNSASGSEPAPHGEVTRHFTAGEWPVNARATIDAVTAWTRWPLFRAPPLSEWVRGHTALIGDAAHAMLPFAAQGAGMAIEDAAVLAKCLADSPGEVTLALKLYETLRRPRVMRVQHTAQTLGQVYQLSGVAALARDMAMITMGGARIRARQDWIYDWKT